MEHLANLVLALVVGHVIGIGIGLTGIGGGALVQPALIHLLGVSPVYAVGTGLLYAFVTRIFGTAAHLRLGTVHKRIGGYVLIGSVPGVLLSARTINVLVEQYNPTRVNTFVQIGMGIVLLVTCVALLVERHFANRSGLQSSSHQRDLQRTDGGYSHSASGRVTGDSTFSGRRKALGIVFGFVIGALVGATSIGGGVLIIPVLMLFFEAKPDQAVGTSIMISVVLAILGGAVYLVEGHIVFRMALMMCIGSPLGVIMGSHWAVKLPDHVLRTVIIVVVAVSGISLFFGLPH